LGTHFAGWRIGDRLIGKTDEGHSVDFWGRLSDDGNELEGHWSVEADPKLGRRRHEGGFVLTRTDE
jgi:hypothetical protein